MNTIVRKLFNLEHIRAVILLLVLAAVIAEALYCLRSPKINLLPPHHDGEWLRSDISTSLNVHPVPDTGVFFKKDFLVDQSQDIDIFLTAFRQVKMISLDGKLVPFSVPSSWKRQMHIVLPRHLLYPGMHEIRFLIVNQMAPPLFHLTSSLPGLAAGAGWQTSDFDKDAWTPAVRAGEKRSPEELRSMFPTAPDGARSMFFIILPLFLGTFSLVWLKPGYAARLTNPVFLKYLLAAVLIILGINNTLKHTVTAFGFDASDHLDYISYILKNHRLPLASEGWQMFQPPLYYLLLSALVSFFLWFASPQYLHLIFGAFSLSCLLLLVEISYRMLKELLPEREDLQCCGLFVAALLPMNLYMCQSVGNEPLSAVFTALLLYLTVKYKEKASIKNMVVLGIIAGLAILTKVTSLILIPVVCMLIIFIPLLKSPLKPRPPGILSPGKAVVFFIMPLCIVSGWYFLMNWIYLGKPFIGGWDPSRNIVWWQDPGYRILSDYFFFGDVLNQPIYSAFNGFADALYSTFWSDGFLSGQILFSVKPAWNYHPLAAGILFSVVPAFSMANGVFISYWRARNYDSLPFTFLFVSIGVYFAALVHMYTLLPIYSTVKASYTMGLTPCYAVMVALGADGFLRNRFAKPFFIALLVTWGVLTYIGFFIISPPH